MRGHPILIRCYSNCDRVGLFLNGKSLGIKRMPKYKYLDWLVPYAAGRLTARGYDGNQVVTRYSTQTAGPAAALQLRDQVDSLSADGESVAPIAVTVLDAHGTMVPDAHDMIRFTVSGPGSIAGVNNGNPTSHESNVGHQVRAFHGLCMVVVRAGDHPGTITLTAKAHGLPAQTLKIRTVSNAQIMAQ
jgi:beta-galactosidase